jgi:hypothetical protein
MFLPPQSHRRKTGEIRNKYCDSRILSCALRADFQIWKRGNPLIIQICVVCRLLVAKACLVLTTPDDHSEFKFINLNAHAIVAFVGVGGVVQTVRMPA